MSNLTGFATSFDYGILHESSENMLVRDQLMLLADYAEQWKPTFTAGGFYDVNQSCISSIFSAIITYLVIIIQFNMVLVDDGHIL
ncbi:hypothetical protein JTB14_029677 [Gonioctena quinquepunctata]|nr:hypothetical protein JTB14_029677 [Gonioctena quinquepunctata]